MSRPIALVLVKADDIITVASEAFDWSDETSLERAIQGADKARADGSKVYVLKFDSVEQPDIDELTDDELVLIDAYLSGREWD